MENGKGITDLPIELLWEILLRLPVKSLLLLRRVCKKWLSLISDPSFAKSHFELGLAPTHRFLLVQSLEALSYDLDALFTDGHAPVKFPLPVKKRPEVVGSCRGFMMLDDCRRLIIWNPSTGAHKRISYPRVVSPSEVQSILLYCFGYDASTDDYLVGLGWSGKNEEDHFNLFSMRTNSWKNLEVALPTPLIRLPRRGLFLNGAFHWLAGRDRSITVFDLKERSFSGIPVPEQVVHRFPLRLMELQGCLALHALNNERKPVILVMEEYKVLSSWTLYGPVHKGLVPISLSRDGKITGYDLIKNEFLKYNASGQKLEYSSCQLCKCNGPAMYTESLLSLPNHSKGKKKGRKVHQECFQQLDSVTNNNHNEDKENKRIRRPPIWTRDFYCN